MLTNFSSMCWELCLSQVLTVYHFRGYLFRAVNQCPFYSISSNTDCPVAGSFPAFHQAVRVFHKTIKFSGLTEQVKLGPQQVCEVVEQELAL